MSKGFSLRCAQSNQITDMLLPRQLPDNGIYFFYDKEHNEVYNYQYSLKLGVPPEFSFSRNGSSKQMIKSTNGDKMRNVV